MECCVCWNPLTSSLHGASFSKEGQCRPDHLLCTFCYAQCDACPLCRFSPREKPPTHAEAILDILRENKTRILEDVENMRDRSVLKNKYNDVINQISRMKDIVNASNSRIQ